MQGTIHRLIRGKGFGFIQVEDRQYFFHHTEVRGVEFKELVPGDVVAFNAVDDEQGRNPRAVEVLVVEKKEKPPRRKPESGPQEAARHSHDAGAPGRFQDDIQGFHDPVSVDSARDGHPPHPARGPRHALGPAPHGSAPHRPPRGRGPRRGPLRSRKPDFHHGRADAGAQSYVPRALEPGPADDGEFTEDLSAARGIESIPAAPRRSRGSRRPDRPRDDPRSQRPRASGTPGERGEGVVRAMNPERGFGFIETDRGDIFFHRTSVKDGFESLNLGARVMFVFGEGDRGSKAEDVVVV